MGGAFGTCGGYGYGYGYGSEILRERDHLQYLCVDDRIILKWIFKKWDVGMG
jgi:hypothetical protein